LQFEPPNAQMKGVYKTMRKEYSAPKVMLVGDAERVVLGSLATGNDILDEILIPNSEFEMDPGLKVPASSQRR
jgi:hypothetical protein